MDTFLNNQNDPHLVNLLKASSVAYSQAKKSENLLSLVSVLFAVLYPVIYLFYNKNETALFYIFLFSFLYSITLFVISKLLTKETVYGALYKEEFDLVLFGLQRKITMPDVDVFKVSELSGKYKGEIIDWYPKQINDIKTKNIQIALCQKCNAAWDIKLRKKYQLALILFLIVYTLTLVFMFIVSGSKIDLILYILFSVIGFYLYFIDMVFGHQEAICLRENISKHLDRLFADKRIPGPGELREIQDEIYISRKQSFKVPDFFFRLYKNSLSRDIENFIKNFKKTY